MGAILENPEASGQQKSALGRFFVDRVGIADGC
jgi:hypothetical protein